MLTITKSFLVALSFNILLTFSDNLTITAFPFTINQNLSQNLFISIFIFIFYFILDYLFIRNLKIDKFIKDAFIIFIIFTTPLIIFQIQNINRLYFYLVLLSTYLLFQYLEDKKLIVHAGLIIGIFLLNTLAVQNLSNETITDTKEESIDLKPNILTLNFGLDQYLELNYLPTGIDNISFSLNPTGRNPYTAVFKIENISNPNSEDIVFGQFENENLQFKYDYFNSEGTYYVEAYFLGLNNLFEITILSKDEKLKSTFKFEPPEIQVENKFQIEKNFDSTSWLWISGAGDSQVLFLDKLSNPRAYLSLNKDYSRGPSRAQAQLYDDKIVFFNDNDYKYYSMNFFGNFKNYFDNDLNRQYEFHHDISPSKESNLELVLVNDLFQKPFVEDVVIEIDTSSHSLVRTIDLKDILDYKLPPF